MLMVRPIHSLLWSTVDQCCHQKFCHTGEVCPWQRTGGRCRWQKWVPAFPTGRVLGLRPTGDVGGDEALNPSER
jgi:hypothetical protein